MLLMNRLDGKKFISFDSVPGLPMKLDADDLAALVKRGMIPKKDLVVGGIYYGKCRNARVAVWDGTCFIHWRNKWGDKYEEDINHPEDDKGFDVFVPIRKLSDRFKKYVPEL
jgi:hypothetical protein